jgi:hypothetical protein
VLEPRSDAAAEHRVARERQLHQVVTSAIVPRAPGSVKGRLWKGLPSSERLPP